ncbi:polysaccharide deacetylase family protein [Sphingosinithalassobacter portus]|uniref:polysaccharide deacetylase family protein n=1 Tax=Stakelama portus TaxID=2676234 RepID=UPI001EFDA78D|nr:polysaccharide deacetylase family protein [Sphingosinithalassobacter portus]
MTVRALFLLLALIALLLPEQVTRRLTIDQVMPPAAASDMPTKRIAISFDDAPRGPGAFLNPDERPAMLIAALKGAGVDQAAFFVNPGRISAGDRHEKAIDAYVAAGHVIADHSFTHPRLSGSSAEAYLANIDRAEAWLKDRPGYRPWFRYPYLDEGGRNKGKRDAVREGLVARGLRDAYVTVDGSDWHIEQLAVDAGRAGQLIDMDALRDLYVETHVLSAEFTYDLTERTLGRPIPQVMLLHETDLAALFIGDLVQALRDKGWEIVTMDAAYADPVYAEKPDTPMAAGTLVEMLAWEHKVTGMRWFDRNEQAVGARLFRTRVLHEGEGQE